MLDPANWGVVLTTLVVIALTVTLHYEVLLACSRRLPAIAGRRPRRVLLVIFVALIAHAMEIWLFALGYNFLSHFPLFGGIVGDTDAATMLEHAYFSGLVYSTVGFGDLVPVGPVRFMAGMEALTGLVMITWTASYTYFEMRRSWRYDGR